MFVSSVKTRNWWRRSRRRRRRWWRCCCWRWCKKREKEETHLQTQSKRAMSSRWYTSYISFLMAKCRESIWICARTHTRAHSSLWCLQNKSRAKSQKIRCGCCRCRRRFCCLYFALFSVVAGVHLHQNGIYTENNYAQETGKTSMALHRMLHWITAKGPRCTVSQASNESVWVYVVVCSISSLVCARCCYDYMKLNWQKVKVNSHREMRTARKWQSSECF